jgi:hypothetical protein
MKLEDLNKLESFEDIYIYCQKFIVNNITDKIYNLYLSTSKHLFSLEALKNLIYFIKNIENLEILDIIYTEYKSFYLEAKRDKDSYIIVIRPSGETSCFINVKSFYCLPLYELLNYLNNNDNSI